MGEAAATVLSPEQHDRNGRIDEACALLESLGTMALWHDDNGLVLSGERINTLTELAQKVLKEARHG